MRQNPKKSEMDIEWANRNLCNDESCIGVIGPDGRCKECGLRFGGNERDTSDNSVEYEREEVQASLQESAEPDMEDSEIDVEWENRILCSDESCIGIIGPDGKCKECGKL